MNLNVPVNPGILEFSKTSGQIVYSVVRNAEPQSYITFGEILTILYLMVSMFFLLRFIWNIFKIISLIWKNPKLKIFDTQIVLINTSTPPHSFFRYIFVNSSDYKNGNIDHELLVHESTHCIQYHSIDILIIELVNIAFWFNPLILIFKKAIQLNHEYLADCKVLLNFDLKDYQKTLIGHVFRNNSIFLASNFNYSLTKKRLIMMTKNNSKSKAIIRKIAVMPVFLILTIILACSKDDVRKDIPVQTSNLMNMEKTWWYPILKELNIEPRAYNTFGNVFEMGTKNSIDNKIVTLENAFFLIRNDSVNFSILKSPLAYHDLDSNIIRGERGSLINYRIVNQKYKQEEELKFEGIVFKMDDNRPKFRADKIQGKIKSNK
jgi:hypothetical protein